MSVKILLHIQTESDPYNSCTNPGGGAQCVYLGGAEALRCEGLLARQSSRTGGLQIQ